MSDTLDLETRRPERECDCPPFVLQCAHFPDGSVLQRVWMCDADQMTAWHKSQAFSEIEITLEEGDEGDRVAAFHAAAEALLAGGDS